MQGLEGERERNQGGRGLLSFNCVLGQHGGGAWELKGRGYQAEHTPSFCHRLSALQTPLAYQSSFAAHSILVK